MALKLADRFRSAIEKRIDSVRAGKDKCALVGIVENQHYESGEPVAYIAAIHEYGSITNSIPARPFIRPTVAEQKKKWAGIIKDSLSSGNTLEQSLDLAGMVAAGDITESISKITDPPLKASTIKARNKRYKTRSASVSAKPLVDTGVLISSITSKVTERES